MIVRQNKGYEKTDVFPNTNWYEDQPNNYVVDETTVEGKALAAKIVSLYPYYNFILANGQLVDVVAYEPSPEEVEANTPPKTEMEMLQARLLSTEDVLLVLMDMQMTGGV